MTGPEPTAVLPPQVRRSLVFSVGIATCNSVPPYPRRKEFRRQLDRPIRKEITQRHIDAIAPRW